MTSAPPPLALLFWRLGPYHVARLQAAARHFSVTAIEFTAQDDAYAWAKVSTDTTFDRVTLQKYYQPSLRSRLNSRRLVSDALDKIRPATVVLPGWSFVDALSGLQWCVKHRVPAVVMSESTAWDEPRVGWKEAIKRRLVSLFSAGLVGGAPHAEYLAELGLPRDRIFLGYDAVDNAHFSRKTSEPRTKIQEQGTASSISACQHFSFSGTDQEPRTPTSDLRSPSSALPTPGSQLRPLTSALCPPSTAPSSALPTPSSQLRSPISDLRSPYFLASARFIEKKNLPRLIQAYARYRQLAELRTSNSELRTPDRDLPSPAALRPPTSVLCPLSSAPWPLVLLGDGPLREQLELQLSALSLQAFISLPGFKQYDELPHYYAQAGAFIHASTTEQWGLVVNEAMAAGLPVLVSNRCGCARDLVQEGVNGFTFDPHNIEQLAQLMLKLSAFQHFSFSAFGSESQRLIADWGPDRFASGLKSAVETALRVGPPRAGFVNRILLNMLLFK